MDFRQRARIQQARSQEFEKVLDIEPKQYGPTLTPLLAAASRSFLPKSVLLPMFLLGPQQQR